MASESLLMDLPKELFDNVIAHYVHSVHVRDASATRAVCKPFDQAISYQIVNRLPESSLFSRNASTSNPKVASKTLCRLVGEALRSQARKTKKDPLVTPIYVLASTILNIEGNIYDEETKARYVEEIIRYIERGGMRAAINRVSQVGAPFIVVPPLCVVGVVDAVSPPSRAQNLFDLTGAAAVGSLVAVKHILKNNPKSWPSSLLYLVGDALEESLFSDPLRAAASNGHVEVMQYLFTRYETDSARRLLARCVNMSPRFQCTLSAAIQSKHCPSIRALAEFFMAHHTRFDLSIRGDSTKACAGNWIKSAVMTGCVKTYKATLSAMEMMSPIVYESESDYLLELALIESCKQGKVALLRRLIIRTPALLPRFGWRCMQIAAQYCRRNVIDMLLENGISINEGRAILHAIKYDNISMIKFMAARGARIDRDVWIGCPWPLNHPGYHRMLWTFDKKSMTPVTLYYVAKLVEKNAQEHIVDGQGREGHDKKRTVDDHVRFIEDVQDSKFWSGRVETVLGM